MKTFENKQRIIDIILNIFKIKRLSLTEELLCNHLVLLEHKDGCHIHRARPKLMLDKSGFFRLVISFTY